jgi:hypothetical protein
MNFHGVLKLELKDNEKSEGFVSNFILWCNHIGDHP